MAKAAYNDYDTRRSLEAAALSGSEEAKKFREQGFHNREDVTNLNKASLKVKLRSTSASISLIRNLSTRISLTSTLIEIATS